MTEKKKSKPVKAPMYGIAELNGHVHSLASVGMQADKCTKTTKAIAEYVGREHGQEMRMLVLKGTDGSPEEPQHPEGDGVTDKGTVLNMERGKVLACLFMEGVNKKDYGGMLKKLADDYALGAAKYPETVEAALQVLAVHNEKALRKRQGGNAQSETNPTSEMSMAQNGRGPQCWKCGKNGHLKRDCPEVQQSGQTHAQNQLPSWMVQCPRSIHGCLCKGVCWSMCVL